MLDTGSSVNIISKSLFFKIGKADKIPAEALQQPDIPLKDYNQNTIPVTARVSLEIRAKDHVIHVPVYILPGAKPACLLGLSVVCDLDLVSLAPEVTLNDEDTAEGSSDQRSCTAQVCLISIQQIPRHLELYRR